MARRKPFDQLSPTYQQRLRQAGITPAMHDAGVDLRRARGHGRSLAAQAAHEGDVPAQRGGRVEFTADPPMPAQARAEVRDQGGPFAALMDRGLPDTTAWTLSQSGAPPLEQWRSVDVIVTPEGDENAASITDSGGRVWDISLIDGDPTWSVYDLGQDIGADVSVGSAGAANT